MVNTRKLYIDKKKRFDIIVYYCRTCTPFNCLKSRWTVKEPISFRLYENNVEIVRENRGKPKRKYLGRNKIDVRCNMI